MQLVANSEPSESLDGADADSLNKISRKTLGAYERSKSLSITGSREIYSELLPYSKAFYVYTHRAIPTELDQALANVEPIPRANFDAIVIQRGAEGR